MSELETLHLPLDPDNPAPTWEVCPLRDVAMEIQTGFASGEHNRTGEGIPHLRPMNISPEGKVDLSDIRFVESEQGDSRLRPGDVLFNNTNSPAWVGKTALIDADSDWAFSNHMTRLRFAQGVEPGFIARQLHFYCRTGYFQNQCKKHVNQASISRSFLADSVPIFVAPSNEQKRIVAKLDALQARHDAAKHALEAIPPLLEKFRQSVLAAAFRGDLTREWRARNPDVEPTSELLARIRAERRRCWEEANPKKTYVEPEPVDTTDLPELPEGWCWAALEELSSATNPICYGVVQPGDDDTAGGVRLVRVCDVDDGAVATAGLRLVSPQIDEEYRRSRLNGGEVLVTVVGTIGRVAVVPTTLVGANIARAVARIVPLDGVTAEWIALALRAPDSQHRLNRESREVARKTLNIGTLERVPIPLCPPRQADWLVFRVSALLGLAASLRGRHQEIRRPLDGLSQSILAKAFRGELVPQDPNDEPASVLLERIRAERAASGGASATKKRRGRSVG